MKRGLLIGLLAIFCMATFSQNRVIPNKQFLDYSIPKSALNAISPSEDFIPNNYSKDEANIGETLYDLQTNYSMQNRCYLFDDGYFGAVWTMGIELPNFVDRGTGYNNSNGYIWQPIPLERIESLRTGWPSYAPYGENGELAVSHDFSAQTLIYLTRDQKGVGDWSENEFQGPPGIGIVWNRSITSGPSNNIIHILALTVPTGNGGSIYQGLNGALLYSRSSDGGATWNPENSVLNGMTSSEYIGFTGDTYTWASPKGNTLAFLVGNTWTDLFMMKSTDGGDSWEKTIIWNHPYPMFDEYNQIATDTFYCADGSHSIAIDNAGKVHIAFGLNRTYSDGVDISWFPLVGGIAYWNEDMSAFSNNHDALNPYGGPDSELIEDYNLIGWAQDINNNGEWDILGEPGIYYLGASSMPQLITDELNNIFLIYSSVTESYDNGDQDYRHLWARGSNDNGSTWGDFLDLNWDLIYVFSECVFPTASPTTNDSIHLIFQEDNEPGLAVRGDFDPYGPNNIRYMNFAKTDLVAIINGGNLSGIVTDLDSGDPIVNASISIESTFYSTQSGSDGSYTIFNIPAGDFTANCSKMGYYTITSPITVSTGNTTTQDFVLELSGLNPPSNLSYEFISDDVLLSWDPPETGKDFLGYNIYKSGNFYSFTTLTEFLIENPLPGTYEYFITSLFDEGESFASNTINFTILPILNPPQNLEAILYYNEDVLLTWDEPEEKDETGISFAKDLLGYNIYRDNEIIDFTTQTIYADEDLSPETYIYFITAIYDEGESGPSNTEEITVPEPCYPPESVVASVIDENYIELIIVPPSSGSYLGFNIYRDGNLLEMITSGTYVDGPFPPGVYEYCVTSVCEIGESDEVCDTAQVFATLPSPTNLFAEQQGENMLLNWSAPNNEDVNSYNIYYCYGWSNIFDIIENTSDTSFIHQNATQIGIHNYYVTAVYDEGESPSTDTAVVIFTRINDNFEEDLQLYPNPTTDIITIKSDELITSVQIINKTGKILIDTKADEKVIQLKTANLKPGIYFIQINSKTKAILKKLIKL